MTVLITLTTAGSDTGPFNLYSDANGYTTAFATNVSKLQLVSGYTSTNVPDFTSTIQVRSLGVCTNFINITVTGGVPFTTTTSTTRPITTTTTTTNNLVCKSYQSAPYDDSLTLSYIDCAGVQRTIVDTCFSGICRYSVCARSIVSSTETMNIIGNCS